MNTKTMHAYIGNISLWKLVNMVPFVFAFHEFEEWNILSWHRRHQSNIPDVADIDLRTIFIVMIVLVFLFFSVAKIVKNKKVSAYFISPVLSIMLYNGLVHLYWSIYFFTYSPGLIFGFFIGVPLLSIIFYKTVREQLLTKSSLVILMAIVLFMLAHAISLGDILESGIVNAMLLGKTLSALIWY